jgi:ABC-2 type transport system ATP-binding protein
MCTHNLDEADRLCNRIAVFKGRLRVVDTPAGLRKKLFGRQIVCHLAEGAELYLGGVAGLPFVREAEALENKLILSLDEPEVHNPDLIRHLVGAGANIQFVGELRHSLEDIYLQLVNEA